MNILSTFLFCCAFYLFTHQTVAQSIIPRKIFGYDLSILPKPFPPCWSNDTHCHLNGTDKFTVFTKDVPLRNLQFDPFVDVGWVIRRANFTMFTAYCSTLTEVPNEVRFLVDLNGFQFKFAFPIDNSSTCSSVIPFWMTLDIDNWWWFFNYTTNPGSIIPSNRLSIQTANDGFYFMVTRQHISIEINQLDPNIQYFWPFFMVNPWSLNSPFYFQVNSLYISDKLNYTCTVTYQQKYFVTGSIEVLFIEPEKGYWFGNCNCPKTIEHFDIELGTLEPAVVTIFPEFVPFFRIYTKPQIYRIFNQPNITGVSPSHSAPNTEITIFAQGLLGGTASVRDDRSHQWDITFMTEDFIRFFLTPLDLSGVVPLCLSISVNNRDYTSSNCTPSNTLYYLGPSPAPSIPSPIPSPMPSSIPNPVTPVVPTTPTVHPHPHPQPAPQDIIPSNWIDWLTKFWWTYIAFGLIGMSIFSMIFVHICCDWTTVGPGDYNGSSIEDFDVDPHVLINMAEVVVGDTIGSGSFAVVYRGYWRKTEVAIKMIQQNVKNEKLTFLKETALMMNLRHPNVVSLMGVVMTPRLCIVTEYCCRGDVGEMLLDPKIIIEPEHLRKISVDTCRGMTYLHASNVIHRDLKCRNLLIDKDWNIKVADFGLARLSDEQPGTMTACGTPTHAAPEVIRHSYYTKKADVYSFGICLWEMCMRKEPYESIPGFRVIVFVATKRMRPKIPATLDNHWASLIRRCWGEDPDPRPDFSELMEIFEKMITPIPTKKMPYREEDLVREKSAKYSGSLSVKKLEKSSNFDNSERKSPNSPMVRNSPMRENLENEHRLNTPEKKKPKIRRKLKSDLNQDKNTPNTKNNNSGQSLPREKFSSSIPRNSISLLRDTSSEKSIPGEEDRVDTVTTIDPEINTGNFKNIKIPSGKNSQKSDLSITENGNGFVDSEKKKKSSGITDLNSSNSEIPYET